jgi:hypothetical protein
MSSERATALAVEFEQTNDAVIVFAQSCSETQWKAVVPGEDWPVGVVIHHIAEGHEGMARWLRLMTSGEGVAESNDDLDERNASHARRSADATIIDTTELLRKSGGQFESLIRGLSDEDLDRTAPFGPAGGQSLLVVALVSAAGRHAQDHLAHAKEALGLLS